MPNITAYMDNETYISFLKLPDEKRQKLREEFVESVKKEVKKRGGKDGDTKS